MYRYSKLILRCENSEWSILGVSNSDNDLLSFVVAPSNAGFDNYLIAPGAYLTDSIYDFTATVTISSYFPIDATKDNWGLSFGYELLSELDDVADFSANYYLADVYGVKVNINSAFEAADEALSVMVHEKDGMTPKNLVTLIGKKVQKAKSLIKKLLKK